MLILQLISGFCSDSECWHPDQASFFMAEVEVVVLSAVQEKLRLLKLPFDCITMTSAFDDSPKVRGWKANLHINVYGQVMISRETGAGSRELKVTLL